MAGFFILLLFVVFAQYWYVAAGVFALWLCWWLVIAPWWRREMQQAKEYQRHQRARTEIDAVTAATRRAMVDATRKGQS
jgi:1,4-dihydroxy-2-naphthoate octaprenyltransferase